MAIKEFVIGPQNYFEEGYFSGDYTYPNVSKSFLECDIDNIKGGRVITGEYYLDNYIDGTYYHNNSIESSMTVEAMVVQEATVGLSGYFAEGYYNSGYFQERGSVFALTAELTRTGEVVEASGAWTSSCSMDVIASKVVEAVSTMSSEFAQTAIITHLEGADLFAFTEAQMAVAVSRIRSVNTDATAVFSISVDPVRIAQGGSSEDVFVAIEISGFAVRDNQAAVNAAFSLAVTILDLDLATANLSVSTSLTATLKGLVQNGRSTPSAQFTLLCNAFEAPADSWSNQPNVRFLLHADSSPLVDETNNSTVTLQVIPDIPERSGTIVSAKFSNGVKGSFITNDSSQLIIGLNDFILDGWFRPVDAVGTNDVAFGFLSDRINSSRNLVGFIGIERQGTNAGRLIHVGGGGITIVSDIAWPYDGQFHHIMLSRTSNTIRLFIDGQMVGSAVSFTNFVADTISSDLQNPSIVDEVRLVIGEGITNNFTPKTTPYSYPKNLYAILEPRASLTIDFLKVKFDQAALISNFSQSAQGVRTRLVNSNMSTTCSLTVTAVKAIIANANLNAESAVNIVYKRFRSAETDQTSVFSSNIANTRTRTTSVSMSSSVSVNCDVKITRTTDCDLNATSAIVIDNSRTRDLSVTTDSIATQLSAVVKIGQGLLAFDSVCSMSVDAVLISGSVITAVTDCNLVFSAEVTAQAQADLNTESQLLASIDKLKDTPANITAVTAMSVAAIKTVSAISEMQCLTTETVINSRVRNSNNIQLSAEITQQSTGTGVKLFDASLSDEFTLLGTVFTLVRIEADLSVTGFVLSAGRVLHLDPYRTYQIPAETRSYRITQETRVYSIDAETRVNIIQGYQE